MYLIWIATLESKNIDVDFCCTIVFGDSDVSLNNDNLCNMELFIVIFPRD